MSTAAPAEPVDSGTLDAVFGALAHPARRRILASLRARDGEMTAGEINDRFKHSWPTTTRHLGVLEDAGIVTVGKRGRYRFYGLSIADLARASAWLQAMASEPTQTEGRADWRELPYATMRNTIPPQSTKE